MGAHKARSQLADFFSATPCSDTLVGGRQGSPIAKLLDSRKLLGPLPADLVAHLPADTEVPSLEHTPNALRKGIREMRQFMAQSLEAETPQERAYRADGELDAAADLVEGLLTYDPAKRLTAAQALEHDFFKR